MEKTGNNTQTIDIENTDIEKPQVKLSESVPPEDYLDIALHLILYKIKKPVLEKYSLRLANAPVAYLGNTAYKIERCIDYFYHIDPNLEDSLKKSIASAASSGESCVILTDQKKDFYVCSLNWNVWYNEVHTCDDFSSQYGGLTYLETRGKRFAANLRIGFLVTSEGHVLMPFVSPEDFLQGNAYYTRLYHYEQYGRDLITYFVYLVKTGKLEKYFTAF